MAPAVRADLLALDPELARLACLRHLEAGHLRLGGRIDAVGPLRCYTHPLFHWTFFNTARLAHPVSDAETSALVAAVRDYYRRRGRRPTLDVSAALAPPTLAPQLAAARFTPDRWEALMVRPPSSPFPPFPEQAGLSIHPITAATLDDFVTAWSQGFAVGADTSPGQVRSLFERDLATAWEFRLARRGQQPVGTIAYLSLNGVVQLANVSTVPAARRQGVAAALVETCLAEAAGQGDRLVYLHAAVGSPAEALYNKLGFTAIDTWTTYIYD